MTRTSLDAVMKPAETQTLREQVYTQIREAIALRQLAPGDDINEVELASALQVSRSPVREAVQQLHTQGLVERKSNGRYQVTRLSKGALYSLYGIRIALEGYAAMEASSKMSEGALAELVAAVEEERAIAATGNIETLIGAGNRIHHLIALGSENSQLEQLIRLHMDRAFPFTVAATRLPERITTVLGEHQRVVEAIASRDPKFARQIMEEHLAESRNRLVSRTE